MLPKNNTKFHWVQNFIFPPVPGYTAGRIPEEKKNIKNKKR